MWILTTIYDQRQLCGQQAPAKVLLGGNVRKGVKMAGGRLIILTEIKSRLADGHPKHTARITKWLNLERTRPAPFHLHLNQHAMMMGF